MSDNSTDPNPSRDPNAYLAPIAGTGVWLIIVYVVIAFLIYKYLYK